MFAANELILQTWIVHALWSMNLSLVQLQYS